MAKYRKKPVVIEAVQWTGDNWEEVDGFVTRLKTCLIMVDKSISIETLEGWMKAQVGDWIIKGVNSEFYPCKPDIFEKTYELVEDRVRVDTTQ